MKKKAFTLIEILVSISIITIVTFSGSYYFFDFLDNKEITNQVIKISRKIDELDNKVKNFEIFDYKVIFNSGVDKYIVYKNIFDNEYYQEINGDRIELNKNLGDEWQKKVYEDYKLKMNKTSTGYFENFDFLDNKDYKINGNIQTEENTILNEIELIQLDKNNKELHLTKISDEENSDDLGNIIIINIGGVKSFSGITDNDFYIHFENKGKEGILKINK